MCLFKGCESRTSRGLVQKVSAHIHRERMAAVQNRAAKLERLGAWFRPALSCSTDLSFSLRPVCPISRKSESATLQCAAIIQKHPPDSVPHNTRESIKSLRHKIIDNELVITKADKGNCTVVMDRPSYNEKMLIFIHDNSGSIDFDFCKYIADVRRCVKSSEVIISPELKSNLVPINPVCPRLYGLLKIHKAGCLIRPIVSFVLSPTYHLCRHLNEWFKSATHFQAPHSIHHTYELKHFNYCGCSQ